MTAIKEEFDAVCSILKNVNKKADGTLGYHAKGNIKFETGEEVEVIVGQTGQGNTKASSITSSFLNSHNFGLALFVGIGGSLKSDFKVFDVAFSEEVLYYELTKEESGSTLSRPKSINIDKLLFSIAEQVADDAEWKSGLEFEKAEQINAAKANIASGEKIIESHASQVGIRLHNSFNDAQVIEMEGYGFCQACLNNGLKYYIVLRGISDIVSKISDRSETPSGNSKRDGNAKKFASSSVANFARSLIVAIHKYGLFDGTISDGGLAYNQVLELIKSAENKLEQFKPSSALESIEEIKRIVESSSLTANEKRISNASLLYISARAKNILYQSGDKVYLDQYIRAFSLCPENEKYKEFAAQAYFLKREFSKAEEIAKEILTADKFNSRAWAILKAIDGKLEVEVDFSKDKLYKLLTFLLPEDIKEGNDKLQNQALISHFSSSREIEEQDDCNLTNYQYDLFKGIYLLTFERPDVINFTKNKPTEITQFQLKGKRILQTIYDRLKTSEMLSTSFYRHLQFYLAYSIYLENPTRVNAIKLYSDFRADKLISFELQRAFDIVMALNEHQLYDEALDVLRAFNFESLNPSYHLMQASILKAKGEIDQARFYYQKYFKEISKIDEIILRNLVRVLEEDFGDENIAEFNFLENKDFQDDNLKKLLQGYFHSKHNKDKEVTLKILDSIELDKKSQLNFLLSDLYFVAGRTEKFRDLILPLIDFSTENEWHYTYLTRLYQSQVSTEEFLQRVKFWRESFNPRSELLYMEAQILELRKNRPRLIELAQCGINSFPNDDQFKFLLLFNRHQNGELVENDLKDEIINWILVDIQKITIAQICIECGKKELALRIAYSALQENRDSMNLRMSFWQIYREVEPDIIPPQSVEEDSYVLIEEGGIQHLIQVVGNDPNVDELIGRKLGEEFESKNRMLPSVIKIIEIYDKYLGEVKRILSDVKNRAFQGGFPLQSVEIPKDRKGDLDIKAFNEILQKTIGVENIKHEQYFNSFIEKYQRGEIGFFNILRLFGKGPVESYDLLTNSFDLGILLMPTENKNEEDSNPESSFVLCLSILPLFVDLKNKVGIEDLELIVTPTLLESLKSELHNLNSYKPENFELSVTHDKVIPILKPNDFWEKRISRLKTIIEWVELNCIIDYDTDVNQAECFRDGKMVDQHLICLLEQFKVSSKPGRILISDERLFHTNHVPELRILNSEQFINLYSSDLAICYETLIEKNYLGITLSEKILFEAYLANKLFVPGKRDVFIDTLRNISGYYNQNPNNLYSFLAFLKLLWLESVSQEEFIRIAQIGFSKLFEVSYLPNDKRAYRAIKAKIKKLFGLLGEAEDLLLQVIRPYYDTE